MADLKKQGAYKYSLDPTTKPTCLAIKVHGQRKITFLDFHQINLRWEDHTPEFRNWWKGLIRDGYLFSAHNSFFEWCVYENILVARLGWPSIPLEQRRCTAAKAAACALPRSLEKAGQALKLSMQKDRRGYSAMMATCKPTKAWNAWKKANDKFFSITFGGKGRITDRLRKVACAPEPPVFLEPEAAPDVWKTLYHYCEFDVRVEEVLDEELPDLSPEEQQIWILNQRLNWRGLRIDIPTVDKIVGMMATESKVKLKELDALTMGLITKPGARDSILEFLKLDGIELPNLKAKTVDDALSGFGLTPDMHRLLEIRKALTMTSTKKYYAMQDRACDDHRVRDILLYHGSSTGRDTGNGLQPHNFPRGIIRVDKRRPYAAVENVVNCDPEMLRLLYGDTLAVLFSSILRNMIIPTDGYELFVADFSKIEVAVLWWLAGNEAGLQALRDGKDPYIFQASQNTGKSYAEIESAVGREEKWALDARQLGKAQVLGCGFGMGWENFQSTAWVQHRLKLTDDQSIAAVSSYRKSNEAVPAFWKAAELAAIAAVERPGTVHEAGRCRFSVSDNFLWLELPSGRRLAFREPQVAWRTKTVGDKTFDAKTLEFWGVNPKTKQWALERTWGGVLVQNATQGAARDLMMPAMVRLEASGYCALLMIHDEGLAEKKIGRGSVDEFTRILCQPPAWARGLPIEAKGWVGPRYRK